MAACCALLVGVGLNAATHIQPQKPDVPPAPTELVGSPSAAGLLEVDHEGFFVPESGKTEADFNLFCVFAVPYGSSADVPSVDRAIAWPEGGFANPLKEEQIARILWGGTVPEGASSVPWSLFWDGYTVSGSATYDGSGDLWMARIWGSKGDASFSITYAPGALPPTCTVDTSAQTGVFADKFPVTAWADTWDRDGDGVEETTCESAFLYHDVGVRATFYGPDKDSVYRLHSLFLTHFASDDCADPLGHLMKAEDVPAFRSADFATLAEALREPNFAPYLPQADPLPGYGEFAGHLVWQEGRTSLLTLRWSKGYDDVRIRVELPEGEPVITEDMTVDVNVPAAYDLRLYSTPWADSVPEEFQAPMYCPAFRAEDMSREVVAAREMAKDTGGSRFQFRVLHPSGAVVEYDCARLTVDQMWALVEGTLER